MAGWLHHKRCSGSVVYGVILLLYLTTGMQHMLIIIAQLIPGLWLPSCNLYIVCDVCSRQPRPQGVGAMNVRDSWGLSAVMATEVSDHVYCSVEEFRVAACAHVCVCVCVGKLCKLRQINTLWQERSTTDLTCRSIILRTWVPFIAHWYFWEVDCPKRGNFGIDLTGDVKHLKQRELCRENVTISYLWLFLRQMDYSAFDRHVEVLLPSLLLSHYLTPHDGHMHSPASHVTHGDRVTTPGDHMTLLSEVAVK